MATANPSTYVHLIGINLLLWSLPASSLPLTSNSDGSTIIKGDVVSSSRNSRQLLMPAIYPYTAGLFMNYQQTPSNTFDQWLPAPSNISPVSSDVEFGDEAVLSARQQAKYPCGRGPAKPPQRTTVGIIGGSEAVKNSWPFIVALRSSGAVFCAGSLISPNKVLTAAHCVEKDTSFDISRMTVSLGMHTVGDGKTTENDAQMTRRVSRVVMHNGYNTLNTVNDIAILTLESPVIFGDAISPVCLAPANSNPDQYAGKDSAIIGWGRTSPSSINGTFPDTLQQATIKVIANALCKTFFEQVTNNSLCLMEGDGFEFDQLKGLCNGDSGGPVIVQSATGAWTQVGIVSFGNPYCGFGPSVNTRVSAYRSWISNNIQ